jgi:hypothetical protein
MSSKVCGWKLPTPVLKTDVTSDFSVMAITTLALLHVSSSAVGSTTQCSPICRYYHTIILFGLQVTSVSVPHTCLKETHCSYIRLTVHAEKKTNPGTVQQVLILTYHTKTKTRKIRTTTRNPVGEKRTHEKPRKPDFTIINRPWAARQD